MTASSDETVTNDPHAMRTAVKQALPRLTERQRAVTTAVLENDSLPVIAKRLRVTHQQVSQDRDHAAVKLTLLLAGPATKLMGSPQQRAPLLQQYTREERQRHPDRTFCEIACAVVRRCGRAPSREVFATAAPGGFLREKGR